MRISTKARLLMWLCASLVPSWVEAGAPPPKHRRPELRAALAPAARLRLAPQARGPAPSPTCGGVNVAPLGGAPFRIGEELSYDLSVAGLFVGRMDMKVGKTRELDGQPALALFARARTNGLTSAIKSFQGRYMVLVEPESFRPVALRTEADYDGDARFEQAKFNPRRTGYNTHFKQDGVVRDRADQRPVALYDLLALLYHARRLPLRSGLAVCQEVYADKRLWRMEARVVGLVKVDTPSGRRSALHVTTRWDRLPHPDFDPSRPPPHAEVDLYFADDATRAPLAFDARTKEGAAHGALVRWVTEAGEGDASWSF